MCFKRIFLFITVFYEIQSIPTDVNKKQLISVEVVFGSNVTLACESNDENHIFFYWYLTNKNIIVGPSNSFDKSKFNYEVLSGNLTIKAVSKADEGLYYCVSRGVRHDDINICPVQMVVQQDWEEIYEHDPNVHLYRAVIILATLMMLCGVGYIGYRIWKNRYRQPSYLVPSDDEEDDSGDELFRAPGVSRSSENMVKTNSTDSFETPGISTDFKSILDTANNK